MYACLDGCVLYVCVYLNICVCTHVFILSLLDSYFLTFLYIIIWISTIFLKQFREKKTLPFIFSWSLSLLSILSLSLSLTPFLPLSRSLFRSMTRIMHLLNWLRSLSFNYNKEPLHSDISSKHQTINSSLLLFSTQQVMWLFWHFLVFWRFFLQKNETYMRLSVLQKKDFFSNESNYLC